MVRNLSYYWVTDIILSGSCDSRLFCFCLSLELEKAIFLNHCPCSIAVPIKERKLHCDAYTINANPVTKLPSLDLTIAVVITACLCKFESVMQWSIVSCTQNGIYHDSDVVMLDINVHRPKISNGSKPYCDRLAETAWWGLIIYEQCHLECDMSYHLFYFSLWWLFMLDSGNGTMDQWINERNSQKNYLKGFEH